ncbi:MAG: FliI/YscN family ATPase [Planctomycetota bacterium]|nr:FliI/YscN family ATPase [Planctomycetota bacterium]
MLEITEAAFTTAVAETCTAHFRGEVERVSGMLVEATGVPAAMGELCHIDRGPLGGIAAEVVGFRGVNTLLMPHGDLTGISPMQGVTALGKVFTVDVGEHLLGKSLDGFGHPLPGSPKATGPIQAFTRDVRREAPAALERPAIVTPLQTGVRALDGLNTVGKGQRLGIFAGSGVGKSTLLGQITRGTDADVTIVCLVGERGREVRDFLDEVLDEQSRKTAVTVVATSDRPPIERFLAPFVAVTIAEYFRDQGLDVLLVMDSVTRFAAASREIGLAAGEPPTVRGYPPSFFATVPKLVERMGTAAKGSITGLITILLDADDPNDPVADTLRGLLDGHVYLSRDLANKGHFPAIDVLSSLSRLMTKIATPEHQLLARRLREDLGVWQEGRELVEIGAYKPGSNPRLDGAISRMQAIEAFLRQEVEDATPIEVTVELIGLIYGQVPTA